MTKEEIEESNRQYNLRREAKVREIVGFLRKATPEQLEAVASDLISYGEEYKLDPVLSDVIDVNF